jgi:hypothetical protein
MTDIGLSTKARFQFLDHSAENSHTQLHFEPIDDTGNNAVLLDAAIGRLKVMRDAIMAVSKLAPAGVSISIPFETLSPSPPVDATSQRELAARMSYSDTVTGKKYRFDIPAPDDDYVPTGSDEINMGAAVWVAFKQLFDTNVVSELGNPVVLISGRFVGRNS